MTIERTVNKLLTNKYVLYFVLVVCVIQVLGYITNRHTDPLLIFILTAILCNCVTKNMNIILLTALFSSKLVHISLYEGMKNKKGEEIDIEIDVKTLKNKKKRKQKNNGDENGDDENGDDENGDDENGDDENEDDGDEDDVNNYDDNYNSSKNNYQKTREESYKNLNKFLDSGEFSKMNNDTNKLINNQEKLAGTMKTLAPMIKNAQNMLKGFNLDKLTGLMGNEGKGN